MNTPLIIHHCNGGIVFHAGHDLLHYLIGTYPPNYPVPATIEECRILSYNVVVLGCSKDRRRIEKLWYKPDQI